MLNFSFCLKQLFPPKCLLCSMQLESSESDFCFYCESSLPYIDSGCSQCSTAMQADEEICGVCLTNQRHWQTCIAPFAYRPPISNLIHEFKFENKLNHLTFFAQCIKLLIIESDQALSLIHIPSPRDRG